MVSTIRTTVTLPKALIQAADQAVREGRVRSRNDLVIRALEHELAAQKRAAIDAAFAAMADDPEVLDEATTFAEGFSAASWEALQIAESER